MKKILKTLVATSFALVLLAPSFSSAQSIGDLQAQIQALLKQVSALQAQIKAAQSTVAVCRNFDRNLKVGDQGDEVRSLQALLQKEGLQISSDETSNGQYGEGTAAAVSGFQQKYSDDILNPAGLKYGTGFTGRGTRAKLNALYGCGAQIPPYSTSTVYIYQMNPSSGAIGRQVVLVGTGFSKTGNTVNFGTGAITNLEADGRTIKFNVPDALNPACLSAVPYPCEMPSRMTTPGTYPVSVMNSSGIVSNSLNFTVTSADTTGNNTPVISGVSGPTALGVGEQGTWTITAYDPNKGTLSYSVVWGDEPTTLGSAARPQTSSIQQTATFTHVYAAPGTYNPRFTVSNANGLSAQTSLSVTVGKEEGSTQPLISNIYPTSGQVGAKVYVNGSNFTATNNTVNFGSGVITGVPAVQWAATTDKLINPGTVSGWTLSFNVPSFLEPACRTTPPFCAIMSRQTTPGDYPVSVTNANGVSNQVTFTVTAASTSTAPVISGIAPQSGPVGTSVTISGSGFSTDSQVNFGSLGKISGVISGSAGSNLGNSFTFTIPEQIYVASGCDSRYSTCAQAVVEVAPGVYPLSIVNANGTSNTINFTVVSASTVAPNLRISSPAAGDNWPLTTGQQIRITLNGMPSGTKYDVVLKSTTMATPDLLFLQSGNLSVDSTGAATLNVTVPNVPVGAYDIYARGVYNNQVLADNTSGVFNIVAAPSLKITSPSAGATWAINSTQQINISAANMPSAARYDIVLYSASNGAYPPVIFLQNSATLTSSMNITVPNVTPGQYYVYARAVVGATVYEAMTGNINIVQVQTMSLAKPATGAIRSDQAAQLASMSAVLENMLKSFR